MSLIDLILNHSTANDGHRYYSAFNLSSLVTQQSFSQQSSLFYFTNSLLAEELQLSEMSCLYDDMYPFRSLTTGTHYSLQTDYFGANNVIFRQRVAKYWCIKFCAFFSGPLCTNRLL